MKHIIAFEAIGDDADGLNKAMRRVSRQVEAILPGYGALLSPGPRNGPWVAEITGLDPVYRFARRFVCGQKDYTNANSIGSRGVMVHFVVDEGPVYEASCRTSWRKGRRYFFRVVDGREIELDEAEVRACLSTSAA